MTSCIPKNQVLWGDCGCTYSDDGWLLDSRDEKYWFFYISVFVF